MIKNIGFSEFVDEFARMGRGAQFSYEALEILFEYLDREEDYSLDVIAICCSYSEQSAAQVIQTFNLDIADCPKNTTLRDFAWEYLLKRWIYLGETPVGFVFFRGVVS